MVRRTAAGLGLGLALAIAAAGCGSSDDGDGATTASSGSSTATAAATTGSSEKAANVAYLPYAYTDFLQAEQEGIKEAVTPGGGSVKVFNANFDPQKQIQQCNDAVTSGRYNAIVLAPVEGPSGVPCVTAAKAAGIPVVSIESAVGTDPDDLNPQVDGVVASIVFSPKSNAAKLVKIAKLACQDLDPCNIIAEVATPTDTFTNVAVDEVAKQVPNAKILQKVSGQYDPSVIAKAFPDALAAHPEANVFLSAADSQALAVVPAVKSAGREGEIRLLGNGGSRLGVKGVEDGTLFATVGNWPKQGGVKAGEFAIQAVNGQTIDQPGVDALELDSPDIITKETAKDFTPEWGAERPE
jgi:ribose transport system substrate-binding protein